VYHQLIQFISQLVTFLDNDQDTNTYIRLVYQPNYSNSKEYSFIPALDVNEQLTIPGRVGCSTQPLKFVMNGSLILGSKDSTNLRIHATLGENVAVLFGSNYYEHRNHNFKKGEKLTKVVDALIKGKKFGQIGQSLADFIKEIDSPDDKTQI